MIETPTRDDLEHIAQALIHAQDTVLGILNTGLDGSRNDLTLIQRAFDSGKIDREAERTIQALGLAFGKVFVNAEADYDWWMINDEYGRDPAIRYRQSSLTFHPQDMLLKRIENDQALDVPALYDNLVLQLSQVIEGGVDGA